MDPFRLLRDLKIMPPITLFKYFFLLFLMNQFTFRPYSTPLEVDFYEFRSILDNPSTSILSLQQVSQILSIFIQHSSQPLPFPVYFVPFPLFLQSKFQYNFCYEQEVNIEHEEFQSSEKLMKNPYFQLLYRSLDVGYVELRGKVCFIFLL